MSIKGHPLQQGSSFCQEQPHFTTVQKAGQDKYGIDMLPKYGFIANEDIITALSYDDITRLWTVTIAGHGAKKHNFVRFVDGSEIGNESPIYSIVDVNNFKLYGKTHLDNIQVGDTLQIIRYLTPAADANGALSIGAPIGGSTAAKQDAQTALLQQIADNQNLPIKSFGILDFASTNVDNTAYVEVKNDVGATPIKKVQIFMSSGEPLIIGFGAIGVETPQGLMIPGGNGYIDLEMPANTRVSVKAVNAVTVNDGVILMNFLG